VEEKSITDLFLKGMKHKEETERIVIYLKSYIKDKRLRTKVVSFIRKHRNDVLNLDDFIDKLFVSKYEGSDRSVILLHTLLENTSEQKFYRKEYRKYLKYCMDFFRLAGLYSLEDSFVRGYFLTACGDMQNCWSPKDRRVIAEAMLKVFNDKELIRLTKRLKNSKLKIGKDTVKALVYYLRTTRTTDKSFRAIAQELGIDKNTAQEYYNEVRDMSASVRVEFLKAIPSADLRSLVDFQNHDDFEVEDTPS